MDTVQFPVQIADVKINSSLLTLDVDGRKPKDCL